MRQLNNKCLNQVNIGDIIQFGNYHGVIDWLVLDKCDNKLLIVTRDCIDSLPYDSQHGACFWRFSSLREWLNNGFIKETFSEDEQKSINSTKILIDDVSATIDKVFLLSFKECSEYFYRDKVKNAVINYLTDNGIVHNSKKAPKGTFGSGDYCLICLPSKYAIQRESDDSVLPLSEWWLRSTKHISDKELKSYNFDDLQDDNFACAPQIDSDGDYSEYCVEFEVGIRPAMWICIS